MKTKLFTTIVLLAIMVGACSAPAATSAPQATVYPPAAAQASGGSTSTTQIAITNFNFDPETITIKAGSTVTWTNQDSVAHTVVAQDGSWKSDNLAKGASFSYTFAKPGTYAYICSIHPTMKGTIIVQ
jgi:plastocyanin